MTGEHAAAVEAACQAGVILEPMAPGSKYHILKGVDMPAAIAAFLREWATDAKPSVRVAARATADELDPPPGPA